MNPDITNFIEALKEPWQGQLCAGLRDIVQEAIADVQERMQYNKPHFLKNGKYAAVISTSKEAVSFVIFNAAGLTLPDSFEGPPERKTIKLRQGQTADKDMLVAALSQAASTL